MEEDLFEKGGIWTGITMKQRNVYCQCLKKEHAERTAGEKVLTQNMTLIQHASLVEEALKKESTS
jgi:hypothetical protein